MEYKLKITDSDVYHIEVDAETRREAERLAWNKFLSMTHEEREKYWIESSAVITEAESR